MDRLEQVSAEPRARWHSTLDRAGIKRADLVFCLSLANLVVLALWFHLSTLTDPGMYYYRDHAPDIALYGYGALAAVLGTVGLAVLFLCAAAAARVWGGVRSRRAMGAVVCGLLIVAVHAISTKVELPSRIVSALTGLLVILALLVLSGGRSGRTISRGGFIVLGTLWPLAIITPAAFCWSVYSSPRASAFNNKANAPFLPVRPGSPRVVWIIFDELDQELTFPLRPKRVHMPEFDRLRSISLHAEEAMAAAFYTSIAFPALTTGTMVADVRPAGPKTLRVTFEDGSKADWSQTPNIFRTARERGFNVGVVGWHHPFCRIFGDVLSGCKWEMNHDAFTTLRREFVYTELPNGIERLAANGLNRLRGGPAISNEEYRLVAVEQRAQLDRLIESASALIADRRYGLLLLHFPVPHLPSVARVRNGNYFDNLAETDAILGHLRRKLEDAGLWDSSTLLVTGDHPLRVPVWQLRPMWTAEEAQTAKQRTKLRVPFLLKMAGQNTSVPYDVEFNTLITHNLILEVLNGDLQNAGSVVEWLAAVGAHR